MRIHHILTAALCVTSAFAEIQVPAATAYLEPDADGARISKKEGITGWNNGNLRVSWFGEIKNQGKLTASVKLKPTKDAPSRPA